MTIQFFRVHNVHIFFLNKLNHTVLPDRSNKIMRTKINEKFSRNMKKILKRVFLKNRFSIMVSKKRAEIIAGSTIRLHKVLMLRTKFECLTVWCCFKKLIVSSQKSG